jgi:predicted GNAT superfamily acetyltransferase
MISIRAMIATDAPHVLRINAASRPGVAPLSAEELARLLALPNEHLVATEDDDSALAYLLAFHREAPYDGEEFLVLRSAITEAFIYIDQVAVAAGHNGHGLGRALYGELERIAGRHRIRVLCCEVNTKPSNPYSLTFHKKLGFSFLASLAVLDGREVELLTKVLSQ